MVLTKMKQTAESFLGHPVKDAVINGFYENYKAHVLKLEEKLCKKLNMKGSNVGFTSHRKADEKIYIFSSGSNVNTKYFNKLTKCKLTKKKSIKES